MKQIPRNRQFINILACQVSLHSMHSTSIYCLELLILEGKEGKALATDHRGNTLAFKMNEVASSASYNLQIFLGPPR